MKFANRKLAVIVGQGAFNLATSTSFITDIIKIQKINLSGVMPNDIKISLDLKEDKEAIVHWPEFHSGMVAGLKLSRHVIPLS
jgi:anaphase-promoting complex subunit 1